MAISESALSAILLAGGAIGLGVMGANWYASSFSSSTTIVLEEVKQLQPIGPATDRQSCLIDDRHDLRLVYHSDLGRYVITLKNKPISDTYVDEILDLPKIGETLSVCGIRVYTTRRENVFYNY